jgi:hypothetical protein
LLNSNLFQATDSTEAGTIIVTGKRPWKLEDFP